MICLKKQRRQSKKSLHLVNKFYLLVRRDRLLNLIRELAAATNMPFCVNRWMGGTLTNYETVSTSIAKYKKYLRMEEDGTLDKMHGKESASIKRQMTRMNRDFEGLLNLQGYLEHFSLSIL